MRENGESTKAKEPGHKPPSGSLAVLSTPIGGESYEVRLRRKCTDCRRVRLTTRQGTIRLCNDCLCNREILRDIRSLGHTHEPASEMRMDTYSVEICECGASRYVRKGVPEPWHTCALCTHPYGMFA